jgi:hypothetical protein
MKFLNKKHNSALYQGRVAKGVLILFFTEVIYIYPDITK